MAGNESVTGLIVWVSLMLGGLFSYLIWTMLPQRCGACGAWKTIKGRCLEMAGESIWMEAECTRCKTPVHIDKGGYIKHKGFLWLSTIPATKKTKT